MGRRGRPPKVIDYRSLTLVTVREKSALLFLGIAIFSAVAITAGYFITTNIDTFTPQQQVAKQETKGVTAPKLPTSYIVADGDTLASISTKMYGTDKHVEHLMKANNLYSSDNLEVGKKILIPTLVPQATSEGQIAEGLMTAEVSFKGDTYTVQPGDTLSIIAQKVYGDLNAWVKIAEANGISNVENIEVGTVLKIPKS